MSEQSKVIPRLVIIEGKDKGKMIFLYHGTSIIGRSKGDIIIPDPRISRSHVAIHYDEKTLKLTFNDLKSLNGTFVNGKQLEAGELADGDRLQLGDTIFDCQISTIENEEKSVSKVQEQMKKYQEEKKNNERSVKKKEPYLKPLEKTINKTKQEFVSSVDKKTISISGIRAAYIKMPRIVRVAVLLMLFGFFIIYLVDNKSTTTSSVTTTNADEIENILVEINKLLSTYKYEEALKLAENLEKRFPNDSRTHMVLGNIYARQYKNEKAISEFIKVKQLEPKQPLVHVKLIYLYLRSNLKQDAKNELVFLDNQLKNETHNRELFIEAAHLFLEFPELEQPPEKTVILAKALQTEMAPNSTIGYKLEAQVLFQQEKYDIALGVIKRGMQIDPTDEWLLENLAFAQLSLKDNESAKKTVETWTQIHPLSSKALLIMAHMLFNENQPEEALIYAEKIIQNGKNNPQDQMLPEAYYVKGLILMSEKKLEPAISYFKQSCDAGFKKGCEHLSAIESISSTKDARVPDSENKSEKN